MTGRCIWPLHHQSDYLGVSGEDLARVMRNTMARLDAVIGGAQYNDFLRSAPHDGKDHGPSYHWHLEICPRTPIPTGFELGSGLFVNTISPEMAAERLRSSSRSRRLSYHSPRGRRYLNQRDLPETVHDFVQIPRQAS